jgi:3-deoxy-manno-octulosonate cytidylyltransferase (CMP-KDO synthetase)
VAYAEHDAWCGTQRIAMMMEAGLLPGNVIINVQCDEPCVPAEALNNLVECVMRHDGNTVSTIVAPITDTAYLGDPNVVKASVGQHGECQDFVRSDDHSDAYHHVGVYGFRRETLLAIGKLPPSHRSKDTSLEQLTWLDNHYAMVAVQSPTAPLSINTDDDYRRFVDINVKAML